MSGKSYFSKPTNRFFSRGGEGEKPSISDDLAFEFDESDLWNSHLFQSDTPSESKKMIPTTRSSKKYLTKKADSGSERAASAGAAESLPVNIPDWTRIIHREGGRRRGVENEYSDDENGERIPPHEYLARTRRPSFSVHEGVGRTLKGRDLSSVRNAVWEKIGFQD